MKSEIISGGMEQWGTISGEMLKPEIILDECDRRDDM